jgi:hypothetical protein
MTLRNLQITKHINILACKLPYTQLCLSVYV